MSVDSFFFSAMRSYRLFLSGRLCDGQVGIVLEDVDLRKHTG
jgi:hypothetical protein